MQILTGTFEPSQRISSNLSKMVYQNMVCSISRSQLWFCLIGYLYTLVILHFCFLKFFFESWIRPCLCYRQYPRSSPSLCIFVSMCEYIIIITTLRCSHVVESIHSKEFLENISYHIDKCSDAVYSVLLCTNTRQ